jgi:CRISPR-associated exonuclease Cas4
MRGVSVTEGALWYQQERKREQVMIDEPLRELTLRMIAQARAILDTRKTPAPTKDKSRCKACSLVDLCMPDMARTDKSTFYIQQMFNEVSE